MSHREGSVWAANAKGRTNHSLMNGVPQKCHVYLEPQNVTLFGNRVSADVIG